VLCVRVLAPTEGLGGAALVGVVLQRMRTAVNAWPLDDKYQVSTKVLLRGVYLHLSSRGSVVICPTWREFIYIALGLEGNSSIQTVFYFPCSIG
jgi:hypothetical protein